MTDMSPIRSLPDHEWNAWSDLRLSLATGSGVRRNARREIDMASLASRIYEGRRLIRLTAAELEQSGGVDDVGGYLPHQTSGDRPALIRVVYPHQPTHTYELDMADYMRMQRVRLGIERKYWPGHVFNSKPFGWSPFGQDRFRKFDPLPAFDCIGSSSLITYISR